MAVTMTKYAPSRFEVERAIEDNMTPMGAVPVDDLVTLRIMARALGKRTYKEEFCGIGYHAFDHGHVHLFCRSGEVS
jgi:hypothetical protein